MRIYHITSPQNAVAIIENNIFYPASNHQLNNDNGLNGFCYKRIYMKRQCFEGVGAKLILEWSGPIEDTDMNTPPPLPPNILHIQNPWRCFIRGGTDAQYIRIVGVLFYDDQLDSILALPSWHCLLPQTIKKN